MFKLLSTLVSNKNGNYGNKTLRHSFELVLRQQQIEMMLLLLLLLLSPVLDVIKLHSLRTFCKVRSAKIVQNHPKINRMKNSHTEHRRTEELDGTWRFK